MFPPETIGVIGHLGNMAKNVVVLFFEKSGYKVIGSDLKDPKGLKNEEVVAQADVVYFSLFPFSEVAPVMRDMIRFAKPGSLWLHGTSIQNLVRSPITPVLTDT